MARKNVVLVLEASAEYYCAEDCCQWLDGVTQTLSTDFVSICHQSGGGRVCHGFGLLL